jgi:hypothetical protein
MYRHTARALSGFPDVVNDFWVTAGLADVWNEVRLDYVAGSRDTRPEHFTYESLVRALERSGKRFDEFVR